MDSSQKGSLFSEFMSKSSLFLSEFITLWFAGFKEACCFHRLLFFFKRSRILLKRTGHCFLLNGLIFLGSIFLVRSMITPMLQWILPVYSQQQGCLVSERGKRIYLFFQAILITFFYVLWFYPMYVISFIISSIWYNEIAQQACTIMKQTDKSLRQKKKDPSSNKEHGDKQGGFERMMIMIGEQIYSVIMLSVFFIEVSGVGYLPYVGRFMNFLLLSWVYAYYCFEYKWNSVGWSLNERIEFFELNWAFFAGFGSPCVLATFFSSQLVSYGIMAILYPLFVLTATASDAQQVISLNSKQTTQCSLRRIPIFYIANTTLLRLLKYFQPSSSRAHR